MSEESHSENENLSARLSAIETLWTMLFKAHGSQEDARLAAQKQLLLRYYGAAYRYLLGTVRDPGVADELSQEFAVRFLRGDFHRADPQRGRFRDFLRTSLRHLAQDHWRKQNRAWLPLPEDPAALPPAVPAEDPSDQEFLTKWREELLSHAWEALAAVQTRSGQPYWQALRAKTAQPELRSAQLADQLASHTGRPWTQGAARQLLHRARNLFADLLVDEVARSLETVAQDDLEQELIDLDLLSYCQAALQRRKNKP
jgi:DNA-directed RNA polymerase specialized sigma24 family protein